MFESAELGHRKADRDYERREPKLREALLKELQNHAGRLAQPREVE